MKRKKILFIAAVFVFAAVFFIVPFIEYPELTPVSVTVPVSETKEITAAGLAKDITEFPKQESVQGDIININTASAAELMSLPGIGEVKAEAIITYRNENGGFDSVDELTEVKGIGQKTLEKLRNRVCI